MKTRHELFEDINKEYLTESFGSMYMDINDDKEKEKELLVLNHPEYFVYVLDNGEDYDTLEEAVEIAEEYGDVNEIYRHQFITEIESPDFEIITLPEVEDEIVWKKQVTESINNELHVADNSNIESDIDALDPPLDLEVIPNKMGINLSNVESEKWTEQDDGQLEKVEINFNPDDPVEDTLESTFKYILDLNGLKYSQKDDGIEIESCLEDVPNIILKLNEDNSIDLNDEHFEDLNSFIDRIKKDDLLNVLPEDELDVLREFEPENNDNNQKTDIDDRDDRAIKKYRSLAGLTDEEEITEENLNEKVLNKCSCYLNYDLNELREVLLNK